MQKPRSFDCWHAKRQHRLEPLKKELLAKHYDCGLECSVGLPILTNAMKEHSLTEFVTSQSKGRQPPGRRHHRHDAKNALLPIRITTKHLILILLNNWRRD